MQKNNIDDKLFDAVLKAAAEEALRQDIEKMPSCEELNTQYKPSPDLDKRIRKIISQHKRKEKAAIWKKAAMKVAVSVALFIVISSAVLLSVEATRNYIFNAIIKWQEDYFSIEHGDNANEAPDTGIYRPTYLTEGFEEVSSNIVGDIIKIVYQNEDGIRITFNQYPSQFSNILADHEDKKYIKMKINGRDAYLLEATEIDKNNTLIWETGGVMFDITSEMESDELILIAEGVKK